MNIHVSMYMPYMVKIKANEIDEGEKQRRKKWVFARSKFQKQHISFE